MTDEQPEALRIAAEFERFAADHAPSGWPAIQQRELTNAAITLRAQHKQIAAYGLLSKAQEAQLSEHRAQADKYREATATLQSERDANAALTAEIERKDALLSKCLKHVASNISMTSDGTEAEDLYDAITSELAK